MEEHQITRHLLGRENQNTEEVRGEHNNSKAGVGDYSSSLTNVLLLSSFVAVCGSFNYGLVIGFSSPVESEIMDDLGLSTAEYSLFGSIMTIGGALGAIASGKMSDCLGRRGTFVITDIVSIAGWIAIIASQGILPLYVGRLMLGFTLGLDLYVIPVYIAEITPKDLRGRFVSLHMIMVSSSIATAYILGVFISWRVLATIGIIPNLIQLIGVCFIPESPRWLAKVHKETEFRAALQRLRGSSVDISIEAADIKEMTQGLEHISKVNIFELFQRKYMYTLIIGIGMCALSQLDGLNGILYYASSIFESVGLSTKLGSIMTAVVQVSSALLSLLLMDRFGRRSLLMVSASGITVANMLIGISFILQDYAWFETFTPYMALISILMFCAFYTTGVGVITFLLISEIYPMNIKGLAGSVTTLVAWVMTGVITYAFNFSMEWSSAGTYFTLSGICAFTLLFVVMLVPETKGKTLEEIQASINHKFHTKHQNQPHN